jgi:dTDP-4-dehydrorhamnose 3,5-epimerase-like enzyme
MAAPSVHQCKIIDLPKIPDPRGNLTFIESNKHIPFEIKRVFYTYDVPGGETRADHANINAEQFIVAMSGSFDVIADNGKEKKRFHLNRAYYGLYVPKMIWRGIENFSSGAVCLVLTSTPYDASDYIRNYEEFLGAARK